MEEKQTRTNKYKDLREATKENQEDLPVVETIEEEDDFLSFIPKSKDAEVDESMLNPLSYETLEIDENVKSALNRVKQNIGKDDFTTRMDILNRLKADHRATSINVDEEDLSEGKDVSSPMSVQETLTEMSQEKEEPVIPVVVEEETTQLSKKEIKALKKQEKETAKQEKEEEKAVKRQEKEEEKALKKQEKEAKKQEKEIKKQAKKTELKENDEEKKAHPVLDFFLNLIIVLLFLAVLSFIVYTILVQMKIV